MLNLHLKISLTILFIAIFQFPAFASNAPKLTMEAYLQIKDYSQDIIRHKLENPNHQIIFIGRSSIFLAAYLRSIDFMDYKFLPVSNIKYYPNLDYEHKAQENFKNLSWDYILPDTASKNFILIDYINSGETFSRLLK